MVRFALATEARNSNHLPYIHSVRQKEFRTGVDGYDLTMTFLGAANKSRSAMTHMKRQRHN
jgi:hypothetical protein